MSEREGIPSDQAADPSEKRDWDVPPMDHGEPPGGGREPAGGAGPSEERQHREAPETPKGQDVSPGTEPPDESEKRDWDLP